MTRDEFAEFFRVVLPDVLEECGFHPEWRRATQQLSEKVMDRSSFPDPLIISLLGSLSRILHDRGHPGIADTLDEAANLEREPILISGSDGTIRFPGDVTLPMTAWTIDTTTFDEAIHTHNSDLSRYGSRSPEPVPLTYDTGPSPLRRGLAGWIRGRVSLSSPLGSPSRKDSDHARRRSRSRPVRR